jgi:8-oxo-dGTP pyrophosphatase MutT (NUDIX family)
LPHAIVEGIAEERGVTARIPGAVVWKYAGDEVLFWTTADSVDDVCRCVESSFEVLTHLDESMASLSDRQLRVKGTCWTALAAPERPGPDGLLAPNLIFSHATEAEAPTRDFLGPEIDAGFRLGATTLQATLAISAELAAFLMTYAPRPLTDKLRLVAFRKLKGVWQNRHYPICWYRPDLEAGFEYDDRYENPLLLEALQGGKDVTDVVKIVRSLKPGYVESLHSALRPGPEPVVAAPRLEVHCAAACQRAGGDVLLVKRKENKRVHPGKWEFGCAQLRPGDTFESAILRDYLEDFAAKLTFDSPPLPLGTYQFDRDGRSVPGIVVRAHVTNPDECQARKHSSLEWFPPGALPDHVKRNAVPDLAAVLARLA